MRILLIIGIFLWSVVQAQGAFWVSMGSAPEAGGEGSLGADTVLASDGVYISKGNKYTASTSFTVNYGYLYTTIGTASFKIAIYEDSAGTPGGLIAQSSVFSSVISDDWAEVAFSPSVSISSGTTYWIVYMADKSISYSYETGSVDTYNDWGTYPVFSDPSTASSVSARTVSMYVSTLQR